LTAPHTLREFLGAAADVSTRTAELAGEIARLGQAPDGCRNSRSLHKMNQIASDDDHPSRPAPGG
jgi:hypothetical protein